MQNGTLENDLQSRTVIIDNVMIHLREPEEPDVFWCGQKEPYRLLAAAWMKVHEKDRIMSPILIGAPGTGKTTLACVVAKTFEQPVYRISCTSDMRPEDLLITPVLSQENKMIYRASPLVSAVITGGICVVDEANRMAERCWASLAPLLDDRRYVESIITGTKIPAHPEFRFVATINDDASTFNIPEYIESRLKPAIPVEFPTAEDLKEIVVHEESTATTDVVGGVIEYLFDQKARGRLASFSVRDVLNIIRFYCKFKNDPSMTIEAAAKKIVKIQESGLSIGRISIA